MSECRLLDERNGEYRSIDHWYGRISRFTLNQIGLDRYLESCPVDGSGLVDLHVT